MIGVLVHRQCAGRDRIKSGHQIGSGRVVECGSCCAVRGVVESAHNADDFQDFTDVFSSETASPIARWPYSVGVMYPPEC